MMLLEAKTRKAVNTMKHSVIKEKKEKAKRYNWRTHKEHMLGISNPQQVYAMQKAMEKRDAELVIQDLINIIRGYCPQCNLAMTSAGHCMSGNH